MWGMGLPTPYVRHTWKESYTSHLHSSHTHWVGSCLSLMPDNDSPLDTHTHTRSTHTHTRSTHTHIAHTHTHTHTHTHPIIILVSTASQLACIPVLSPTHVPNPQQHISLLTPLHDNVGCARACACAHHMARDVLSCGASAWTWQRHTGTDKAAATVRATIVST
jgi:hypothetical protein